MRAGAATVLHLDDPAQSLSSTLAVQLQTSIFLCLVCTISSLILRRSLSDSRLRKLEPSSMDQKGLCLSSQRKQENTACMDFPWDLQYSLLISDQACLKCRRAPNARRTDFAGSDRWRLNCGGGRTIQALPNRYQLSKNHPRLLDQVCPKRKVELLRMESWPIMMFSDTSVAVTRMYAEQGFCSSWPSLAPFDWLKQPAGQGVLAFSGKP